MAEVLGTMFLEHRRGERPKSFAVLRLAVHPRLHLGLSGVAEDGSAAERSRPELHASLEPPDHFATREVLGHRLAKLRRTEALVRRPDAVEVRADLRVRVFGTEKRALLRIAGERRSRLLQ